MDVAIIQGTLMQSVVAAIDVLWQLVPLFIALLRVGVPPKKHAYNIFWRGKLSVVMKSCNIRHSVCEFYCWSSSETACSFVGFIV